jgi:hypothetical protein
MKQAGLREAEGGGDAEFNSKEMCAQDVCTKAARMRRKELVTTKGKIRVHPWLSLPLRPDTGQSVGASRLDGLAGQILSPDLHGVILET